MECWRVAKMKMYSIAFAIGIDGLRRSSFLKIWLIFNLADTPQW